MQSSQYATDLQKDLFDMLSWEETWLMKFIISKCFVMRVTQSKEYKVMHDYQLYSSTLM